MRCLTLRCAGVAVLLWLAGHAMAQSALPPGPAAPNFDHQAERAGIRQEREAVNSRLQQAEVACYQRFAVEDCLRTERRRARESRVGLRLRESALNDAERRERAAQRLGTVQERQSTHSAPLPAASKTRGPLRSVEQAQTERQRQAKERAQLQTDKEAMHRVEQERQTQANQRRAVEARLRLAEKEAAAKARKERMRQKQSQDAAAGRKPAAPLPPP